jgi:hypothetical protein
MPQKTEGVPPFVSPNGATTKTNSQATITVDAKPSIVENLNCRRSTCFLPSILMSCRSNRVPWYFSDTVLPCAVPPVRPSPLPESSSDLDMAVNEYSVSKVGVCVSE